MEVLSLIEDNVKNISKKSLLGLMGIVTQDSILFNDTVSENIKLGKQDATTNEVMKCFRNSEC